ncbi:HD domain-containing protein [Streptomyces caniscabiei]|uniref:HD domain-containing protein n=1 Tax=Streptomyces caniscabiei TaxID=2746961 RepID=UPI0029B382F0|nr:HD domain-containing protein [Streptomyces caniscabiei]MDX2602576.1 HD domain-containing protein [Streptomyces caniscabiei]MDX2734432.1 HD domain-containing protein [Streptomyces caniscabiei]MDX2776919.1 HD domain-containing protein [Streptomyces caniscabiei]
MPPTPLPVLPLTPSLIPPADEVPALPRLAGVDQEIWDRALPYLDVRDNDVHSLHSYGLAGALLTAEPQARADVVLPAILLHDTGWKTVDPARILPAIAPGSHDPETVRRHETEGAAIAHRILTDVGYPQDLTARITEIVDGHDTRRYALDIDDAVVKDADKLWRLTPHGLRTVGSWFCLDTERTLRLVLSVTYDGLITGTGRAIGRALATCAGLDHGPRRSALTGRAPSEGGDRTG